VITIGHSTAHYISFSRDASMVFSLLAEDRCKSLKFQSNNGNAKTILNKTNNEFLIAASGT
jgi:hypothetical protein